MSNWNAAAAVHDGDAGDRLASRAGHVAWRRPFDTGSNTDTTKNPVKVTAGDVARRRSFDSGSNTGRTKNAVKVTGNDVET